MMTIPLVLGMCVVAAGCDDGDRNSGRRGPDADTSPHLAAKSCALPEGGDTSMVAHVGGTLGNVQTCWVFSDGTVRVELDATPKATLIVNGVKQTVGNDGTADVTVGLDGALLRAPVASAIGDGAGISAPTVTVRLEPPGATAIEGKLEIALGEAAGRRTRALLAAVPSGAGIPRGALGDSPPAIVRGSMVMLPAATYEIPTAIGKAATLGQLDLVAVVKDGAHHKAADCGPYDTFGMVPHDQVEQVVTIYEAATGQKVDGKTFASDYEDCAMMVSGYAGTTPTVESRASGDAIKAYLADVTASR